MNSRPAAYPELVPPQPFLTAERQSLDPRPSLIASWRQRASRWLVHRGLRLLMAVYAALMRAAKLVGPPKRSLDGEGYEILLTGTFYSDNWITAHLRPLAMAKACGRVRVVSVYPVPPMDKVEAIYPPRRLVRLLGPVPARLLTFVWVGVRTRPHIVGGFHLLVNGLAAGLLARLVGSRSVYFCVGGPGEVQNGGIAAENRLFGKMQMSDPVVEGWLLRSVTEFDSIITMGSGAARFFGYHGCHARCHVVPGGIDGRCFEPRSDPSTIDIIFVGRLVPVKRIDVFLQSVRCVLERLPHVTATIVGDGELRALLSRLARNIGVGHSVRFVGHQSDVSAWLKRAKIFVLTSDSEGLALSLMEAMMCGLPAVVSNVGDLADLVIDGVNGYLVTPRAPEVFAERIVELLTNSGKLLAFSHAARCSALRYETAAVAQKWDSILGRCGAAVSP